MNITNPYAPGTANSKLFRIPAILTLKSGRIIACADIRYGNGTDDPANIEVASRYSDDNGKTWSPVQFVNHFDDMEDADHNTAIPSSASFIDSAICEGEENEVYHACDACPAFMGLWRAGTVGKGSGYIDGKLSLCDYTRHDNAESTTLDKAHYPYYISDFSKDGFAAVLHHSDNSPYKGYYVSRSYHLYEEKGGTLVPVMIKQFNKDGTVSQRDIHANVFYALSPVKLYPTYYLWIKKSTDGGETWGDGEIINTQINSTGFTGFAPGRGIALEKDGKKRVIFAVYDNNARTEYTSTIYTDNGGKAWTRGKKANKVGSAGKSSESQMVLMNNNILRMYSRNIAGYISYCDSKDYGESWGEYTLDKSLKYCSNCMFSVINYSQKLDGKNAIVIAYPGEAIRKCGVVKIGLYGEDNKVIWKYRKNVTNDLTPFTYVYSCITEDSSGNILDLYESYKAELSLKKYSIKDLSVNDSEKLSFVNFVKSKIYNKTRKDRNN